MLKQLIATTGLCALACIATPAAAQDTRGSAPAAGTGFKDNVRTAREHGSTSTAREHGSRAAVGRRLSDTSAPSRDENSSTARESRPPRQPSQNNLKQMGLANH